MYNIALRCRDGNAADLLTENTKLKCIILFTGVSTKSNWVHGFISLNYRY